MTPRCERVGGSVGGVLSLSLSSSLPLPVSAPLLYPLFLSSHFSPIQPSVYRYHIPLYQIKQAHPTNTPSRHLL